MFGYAIRGSFLQKQRRTEEQWESAEPHQSCPGVKPIKTSYHKQLFRSYWGGYCLQGYGAHYRVQGKNVLALYKISYEMCRGRTKEKEKEESRQFREQAWKNRIKGSVCRSKYKKLELGSGPWRFVGPGTGLTKWLKAGTGWVHTSKRLSHCWARERSRIIPRSSLCPSATFFQ